VDDGADADADAGVPVAAGRVSWGGVGRGGLLRLARAVYR